MLNESDFTNYNQMLNNIYRSTNLEDFRSRVMSDIARLVPFDSAAFFAVDPKTSGFQDPVHLINLEASVFQHYKAHYEKKDIYKQIVFAGGAAPITDRSSDYMNYTQWGRNEHRVDFLLPQKIYHISCVQIINDDQLVGEISLHRGKGSSDFNDTEMEKLKLLHGHLNNAFKIASTLSTPSPLQLAENNHREDEVGICLLNRKLRVVGANNTCLKTFSKNLPNGQNVFHHLLELCRYLAQSNKMPGLTEALTLSGILELKDGQIPYRVVYLEQDQSEAGYVFMIILQLHADERVLNSSHKHAVKLSPREQEIVTLVSMGNTNKEIADKLFLSPDSVKTYLKRIFVKTGVSSRTELVYKLSL